MKNVKKICVGFLACVACFGLVGCSNVSQSYADKINSAAATSSKDDDYTYSKVMKDLGKEAIDVTVTVLGSTNGFIYACKGCKSLEDIQAKVDAGSDTKQLVVAIVNNYAVSATYAKVEAPSSSASK